MKLLAHLLSKVGYFLFFILLEIGAVYAMFSQSNFHKTLVGEQLLNVNGFFSAKISKLKHYQNLPKENKILMEENAKLKNQLEIFKGLKNSAHLGLDPLAVDSSFQRFEYTNAQIIDQSIRKRDNYFMIDKGIKDGVQPNMAVLTSRGVIGAVLHSTQHYSTVLSILHSQANIKAKVKNIDYFGILRWNGKDHQKLQLTEIPKYLNIKQGDTVMTAGASAIYPQGHLIGYISSLEPNEKTGDFDIEVSTFEDLATVQNVYVIKDLDRIEIEKVQQTGLDATD